MCEALASTLIAPGLLYVTRAHATADLKMVAAISLFVVSSGCPNKLCSQHAVTAVWHTVAAIRPLFLSDIDCGCHTYTF